MGTPIGPVVVGFKKIHKPLIALSLKSVSAASAPFMKGLVPKKKMTITGENESTKKKLPSPKEMVAHYESKGIEPQEASLKVIEDLQNLLLKVVVNNKQQNNLNPNILLLQRRLESKLDSKPGYPQTLAIGVISGAVVTSVANIWNSVRSFTSSSSP